MKLIVRPADLADADALGPRLRQADRDECWAAAGLTGPEALRAGVESCPEPYAVVASGEAIALFGVTPLGGRAGAPWLLGSDRVLEHYFEFARRSRDEFERLRAPWSYLVNYVDDRNHLHRRWLQWLGFDFVELEPHYGHARLPFWKFEYNV